MNLEQRVRSALKEAGSRIDTGEASTLRARSSESRSKGLRSRPILSFLAGFLCVLLLGLVALLIFPDRDPQVTAEAVPLDAADFNTLEWSAVDALPNDYAVASLAKGPGGWLALAGKFINSAVGDYLILRSSDGVEWTLVEGVPFPDAVHIDEIIGSRDRYFAYGLYAGEELTETTTDQSTQFAEPAVWTSVDGANWQLTPLPLPSPEEAISDIVSYRALSLAVDGSRALILGVEFDEDLPDVAGSFIVPTRPLMWELDETGQWRLIESEELVELVELASGPAGIVATAASDSGISVVTLGAGEREQLATIPGDDHRANLVGSDTGYLVQTSRGSYFSPDAVNWIPVEEPSEAVVTAGHAGGFTIVERSAAAETLWWSRDGTDWTMVGTDDLGVDLEFVSGVAATDRSVAIWGQTGPRGVDISGVEGFLLIGTAGQETP